MNGSQPCLETQQTGLSELGYQDTIPADTTFIDDVDAVGIAIHEHEEGVPQKLHLLNSFIFIHGDDADIFAANDDCVQFVGICSLICEFATGDDLGGIYFL